MNPEDFNFQILEKLSQHDSSNTIKILHKRSKKTYVWRTIECDDYSETDMHFGDRINIRRHCKHPHLMKFYDVIKESPRKIHVILEYCENGSLSDIIQNSLRDKVYFTEEFLSRLLYQIAFTFKTLDRFSGELSPKTIFFDGKYNVKLRNFDPSNGKPTELKMHNLGFTVLQACVRKLIDSNELHEELENIQNLYSNSLLTTIKYMIYDNKDLKSDVNSVLCHPTILLKSTEWSKEKCFFKFDPSIQKNRKEEFKKIDKLRSKEIALQLREDKLNEREHKLLEREREIAVKERIMKEKLHKAELHLQKCHCSRSSVNASSKSNENIGKNRNNIIPESLDSTYISCGDSVIVPTSKKLNVNEIIKPSTFTRTMSERRIRFKGHSPLKDLDFNRRRTSKPAKAYKETITDSSEWLTCSEEYEKINSTGTSKKGKNLFQKSKDAANLTCMPITWTEENKKHAFELLRMINDKENENIEVKHTYL